MVIDRNISMGCGGVFASEVAAAMSASPRQPVIFPVVAGLGGRDVTPEDVVGIMEQVLESDRPAGPLFWGLKD